MATTPGNAARLSYGGNITSQHIKNSRIAFVHFNPWRECGVGYVCMALAILFLAKEI